MANNRIPELNRRRAIISSLVEALSIMPDYSFAEILYSVLRKLKPSSVKVGWLRDVTDDIIFSAIDDVIEEERRDNE